MRTLCLIIAIGSVNFGCAMADWTDEPHATISGHASPDHSSNTIHKHVENLARQLFSTSQTLDSENILAVGTILPALHSGGDPLPAHSALGLQIQESLMTFATQAGLKVIEFKTMPNIKISDQADRMLSRKVDELNSSISADYFLTGTYTLQENTIMVNIRLIQIPQNIVLAAATDYIPNDAMWSSAKVTLKNNQIYRNGY